MLQSLSNIQQSYSVSFADYVRKCESQGRKILKLQTGDPDFATHPNVTAAAEKAIAEGLTKYCDSRGLPQLRKALAEKLQSRNNITVNPDEELLVTHGAVHAIAIAIRSMINPGDECIIIEPFWRSYEANVLLAGGIPVFVQTKEADNFHLDPQDVIAKMSGKTKLIIINTPNNPSGAVYSETALREVAAAAKQRNILILSDEVYEEIVFGGGKHFSIASVPEYFSNTISVFSFSKTYAMTGWRVGYVVAAKNIIDQLIKLSQFSITSLSPFCQAGAIQALQDDEVTAYTAMMIRRYEERKELIASMIKGTWLQDSLTIPEGTFYCLINMGRFNTGSLELAKKILDRSDVAFTPGIAFGDSMDGYMRLCFSADEQSIRRSLEALVSFGESFS